MNPYREAPRGDVYSVTFNCALGVAEPYAFISVTHLVRAPNEDEAVRKVFRQLEDAGYDVLAGTDVHRVFEEDESRG